MSTQQYLRELFDARFSDRGLRPDQVRRLREHVEQRVGTVDTRGEGYLAPEYQRDLSVKYTWGHDHRISDDFMVPGRMGERHLEILARFMDSFGLERDLTGMTVLDIGCWTGGTSLLMTALGAKVVALEEVRKYAETVNFMAELLELGDRLVCVSQSLYEFLPKHADVFDVILYSGVIYHVSDPLLSLRLIFSALKNGGRCFLESAAIDDPESRCVYEGPRFFYGGNEQELNRGGWNYFIPSPSCAERWCYDAGFQEVAMGGYLAARVHGVARRTAFRDFLRAGLSAPNCR